MADKGFVIPSEILRQDSVIIDDQDHHLVLTLRVPKQLIRSNLPLLMALAEYAGGSATWPTAVAPPASPRKTPHWAYAAAIIVAMLMPSPILMTDSGFANFGQHPACAMPLTVVE